MKLFLKHNERSRGFTRTPERELFKSGAGSADSRLVSGFTIVETLIVMFVFSLIALIVSAVLVRALDIERRSIASQAIQENILAIMELMAKEIRVSQILNQDNNCAGTKSAQLSITHPLDGSIIYRLNAQGAVERVVGSTVYVLSSSDVIINGLGFCVFGTANATDNQPARITILLSIVSNTSGPATTIKVQTTVTSRNLVDEFQN